jgi:hypothetical protein
MVFKDGHKVKLFNSNTCSVLGECCLNQHARAYILINKYPWVDGTLYPQKETPLNKHWFWPGPQGGLGLDDRLARLMHTVC